MRKILIVLFLVFCAISCNDVVIEHIIVKGVEFDVTSDSKTKYKVYLNTFPNSVTLYTNKAYRVGDTIR